MPGCAAIVDISAFVLDMKRNSSCYNGLARGSNQFLETATISDVTV
jgi:hypothetical protein